MARISAIDIMFTNIAKAIREVKGTSAKIYPKDMGGLINTITVDNPVNIVDEWAKGTNPRIIKSNVETLLPNTFNTISSNTGIGIGYFPNLRIIEENSFKNLASNDTATLYCPSVNEIKNYAIQNISILYVGGRTTFSPDCFYNTIDTLVIGDKNYRGPVSILTGRFTSPPKKIYVPDYNFEMYQHETNWIVYKDRIFPISQLKTVGDD